MLQGDWDSHNQYGSQFSFSTAKIDEQRQVKPSPEELAMVTERCRSMLQAGVSAASAGWLIKVLGNDTFHLVELEAASVKSGETAPGPVPKTLGLASSDCGFATLQPTANLHPRDARVVFDPKWHSFTVDGRPGRSLGLCSVTKFCGHFFPAFDADVAVGKILGSPRYANDPSYEYYQLSAKDILETWRRSTELGTRLHKNIEDTIFGRPVADGADDVEFQHFLKYRAVRRELVPYRAAGHILSWICETPRG